MKPGIYPDLDESTYHGDPDSLSHSGAKLLLNTSPKRFQFHLANPKPPSDAMLLGSATHSIVLGAGAEVVVFDAASWRGKEAAAFKEQALVAGQIPLLADDKKRVDDMAEELAQHDLAQALLADGLPECSLFGEDPETGVMRRARLDLLGDIGIDYKTARDSGPREWKRSIANFGYHQQDAWYSDLCAHLDRPLRGFVFIVQSSEAPYEVNTYQVVGRAVARGRELNQRALQIYRDCTEAGVWPAATTDITPIDLPNWAYYDEESA